MDRVKQEFNSRQFDSDQDLDAGNCRFRIETHIVLDKRNSKMRISTNGYHKPPSSKTQSFTTEVVLADWSSLRDLSYLIEVHLRKQDGRTRSITLKAESGHSLSTESSISGSDISNVKFSLDDSDLHISTSGPAHTRLPFYKNSVNMESQDKENIIGFRNLIGEILDETTIESVLNLQDQELMFDAEPEYTNGHYQSSVKTAFRVLEERIRCKGEFSIDMTGSDLAKQAFREDGELEIGATGGEIEGWMFLYAGGFQALRNPPSHRSMPDIDQDRARQILSFVDLLLQTLEEKHA